VDGLRRHLIPQFDESRLDLVAAHVFNERESHPVVEIRTKRFGQRCRDVVKM
jgi:hypothetical protein